jgi:hypothetical protein
VLPGFNTPRGDVAVGMPGPPNGSSDFRVGENVEVNKTHE